MSWIGGLCRESGVCVVKFGSLCRELGGCVVIRGFVSWVGGLLWQKRATVHWPCVTDTVVYPPTGSTAKEWQGDEQPRLWHHLPLMHVSRPEMPWNAVFPMNHNQSEFGQDNCLTRNTGDPLQNWKEPTDCYTGPGIFIVSTTLKLHFNPWLLYNNNTNIC